jgi:hypothetical protein
MLEQYITDGGVSAPPVYMFDGKAYVSEPTEGYADGLEMMMEVFRAQYELTHGWHIELVHDQLFEVVRLNIKGESVAIMDFDGNLAVCDENYHMWEENLHSAKMDRVERANRIVDAVCKIWQENRHD